ncbi:hypothetical protein BK010_06030 [Tenericutes bacterium MO-XQ]|nr:hypothetical protein BK010_06030 [Tenericutes bacterium MO-XQ]
MIKNNGLCIYLEQLRSARHISQLSFVEDIISLRQYRRYLKGESDIPFSVVAQLASKLGLKTDTILREFEALRLEETKTMNDLYNLAVNYAHKEFNNLLKTINPENIIEASNLLLYKHSITVNDYYRKAITHPQVRQMNIDLVNYPAVLEQGILSTYEMLILTFLIDVMPVDDSNKIIDKLSSYLNDQRLIISGGNDKVYTLILAKLAKRSGILESYHQVIKFCEIGITRNRSLYSYYLMEFFYYYQSLAYHRLGDDENFKLSLKRCFNVLEFEGNENKIKKFVNLINDDYDIEFKTYVLDMYQKEQEKGK